MEALIQEYEIHASIADVWDALTDPVKIQAWGGGPAKMDAVEGAKFSLWNGDIHGTNTKVKPQKVLEQDWYSGVWENPSKVIFTLSVVSKTKTKVVLTHTGMPESEYDEISKGWKEYFMEPLIALVEKDATHYE